MSDKELNKMSAYDIFHANSESLEEAQKKSASESSGPKVDIMRLDKEGKYKIRILPLAPVQKEDGSWELPRKGYELPVRELLLNIKGTAGKDGKVKSQYVNVRHLSQIFPQLKNDLIDLFVSIVQEKYADDEKLCKSIRENNFSGGLRYDRKRYMYAINLEKRDAGISLLSLSYSQYKDLDDRKLDLWIELRDEDPKALCPISSPEKAYPVEITRKKENGKTSYTFNINSRKNVPLTEEELSKLLELPRLTDHLYRYSRFHLEATLAYLKQYEVEKDIDVLSDPRIEDLVEQIKLLLPADDQSHFNINGKSDDDSDNGASKETIDSLWATYDAIIEKGGSDQTEEGQNLRSSILDFINANNLEITVTRRTSNADLLEQIEDALKDETKAEPAPQKAEMPEEDEAPAADEDDDDEPREPGDYNDDTAEPAVRVDRRSSRAARRRS